MKRYLALQSCSLKLTGLWLMLGTHWLVPGILVFIAGGALVIVHMLLPRAQGLCDVVTGFHADGKAVWLTIDDGPDPEDTPKILDLLEASRARATFFLIGSRARRHPELVRRILERGHSVGSHTETHPLWNFWLAGPGRVRRELGDSVKALKQAGAEVRYFRSPVGIKSLFLKGCLREFGLRCVAWTIRSGDGFSGNRQAVVGRVLRQVRPGAIILMHEGPHVAGPVRVKALADVLEALAGRGYRCVLPSPDTFLYGSGRLPSRRADQPDPGDEAVIPVGPANIAEQRIAPAQGEVQPGIAGDN